MLGCGSIGQGLLSLLLRHFIIKPSQITVISADGRGRDVAEECGVRFFVMPITKENYRDLIPHYVRGPKDMLINVSVEVSSVALVKLCRELGALYIDTCIEPWKGAYIDPSLSISERSNYALRESMLALRTDAPAPTAIVAQGANPGLVSQLLKEALMNVARDTGYSGDAPDCREDWARLVQELGVRVIHIAERDTQVANVPKRPGEFVNTWSIDGFVSEGCQPAELGWGTHEWTMPHDGAGHAFGCESAIYLKRPGAGTRVRTWTPLEGPFHGFLVTHNESISIADYFTLRDGSEVLYRPTVHYAYHPCDDAVLSLHELAGKNWQQQVKQRLMMGEIVSGVDELGVLLLGNLPNGKSGYWYGSVLNIQQARLLTAYNNATSLQVVAGLLGGIAYAFKNPAQGLLEADQLPHTDVLRVARPYLGLVIGEYTDWTPLDGRRPGDDPLFPEPHLDLRDPWQFTNFRVS